MALDQGSFFRRDPRKRRIMLISGAAAGMAAVFRAPLTGIVFALEMPYKDDLAHEALLPSLIAAVVSYATLASFLGAEPVFDFDADRYVYGEGPALVGGARCGRCGLVAMAFDITFRRTRTFVVGSSMPHWVKMAVGGALTGALRVGFRFDLSRFVGADRSQLRGGPRDSSSSARFH